jgi:hypothetical protein
MWAAWPCKYQSASFRFFPLQGARLWITVDVGHHSISCGPALRWMWAADPFKYQSASFRFFPLQGARLWITVDVGHHSVSCGPA